MKFRDLNEIVAAKKAAGELLKEVNSEFAVNFFSLSLPLNEWMNMINSVGLKFFDNNDTISSIKKIQPERFSTWSCRKNFDEPRKFYYSKDVIYV